MKKLRIVCNIGFGGKHFRTPGATDCFFAYVRGLRDIGHDVYLFVDIHNKPGRPPGYVPAALENWWQSIVKSFKRSAQHYGLWPNCCLLYDGGRKHFGLDLDAVRDISRSADLLLDVGSNTKTPFIFDSVARRAYVDEAPAKTQIQHFDDHIDHRLEYYDCLFTVGKNIGKGNCPVPTGGLKWHGIFHPVVSSMWPARFDCTRKRFTTISNWYKGEVGDARHGKRGEWLTYQDLPTSISQLLEISFNLPYGVDDDIKALQCRGWHIADASAIKTLDDYRLYINQSRAEFSIANERYVKYRTGWTSDRTARYLSSGKPVLIQSTGLEDILPLGEGIVTFDSVDQALTGIEEINGRYEAHCAAANALAKKYFAAEIVLSGMLEKVGF